MNFEFPCRSGSFSSSLPVLQSASGRFSSVPSYQKRLIRHRLPIARRLVRFSRLIYSIHLWSTVLVIFGALALLAGISLKFYQGWNTSRIEQFHIFQQTSKFSFSENSRLEVERFPSMESYSWDRRILLQNSFQDYANNGIVSFQNSLPRINFHFQHVNSTFNPSNSNYIQSMFMFAIPCFIVAFLCLFGSCLFFCLRYCLNLCGGRQPKPEGYNFKQRFIPKQILIAVSLVTIACAVFGFISDGGFNNAFDKLFSIIIDTMNSVVNIAEEIESDLSSIPDIDMNQVNDSIQPLINGVEVFKSVAIHAKSVGNEIDTYRLVAVNIAFSIAGCSALFGLIGALINGGVINIVMAAFASPALFFIWLAFGVHLPLSVMLSDLCISVNSFTSHPQNESDYSIVGLSQIMECLENSSYDPIYQFVTSSQNKSLTEINNITVTCCGIYFTEQNISQANVSKFPSKYQGEIQQELNDYDIFITALNELGQLLNCSLVRNAYEQMEYTVCVSMLQDIDEIMACQGLIGVVMIAGIILGVVASKRLPHPHNKSSDSDYSDDSDVDDKEMNTKYDDSN